MTTPTLADPGWQVFDQFWSSNYTPQNMLIGPGMQVVSTSFVSDAEIQAVLPGG